MGKRTFRVQRTRTPLIGTTLVMIGGAVTCAFVAVPFSDDMTVPLLVIAGMFLLLSFVLGILRQPTETRLSDLYEYLTSKPKKKVQLKLKRLQDIPQTEPRRPPTAEDIREIRGR